MKSSRTPPHFWTGTLTHDSSQFFGSESPFSFPNWWANLSLQLLAFSVSVSHPKLICSVPSEYTVYIDFAEILENFGLKEPLYAPVPQSQVPKVL